MSIEETTNRQYIWLQKLQEIVPNKPILIKGIEGATPTGENVNSRLYRWNYWKDVFAELSAPYFTRSILQCEIVFDPDTPIWEDLINFWKPWIG